VRDPHRVLYLAVPEDTYQEFFTLPFLQIIMKQQQLKLVVYEAEQEVIVAWYE